jgi:hypothetical protein
MSGTASLAHRSRFLTEWLVLLAVLLTFGGYIGYSQYQDYVQIEAHERERLASQAAVIEKNLVPQLHSLDRALQYIREDSPRWQTERDGLVHARHELKLLIDTLPGVRTLLVVNAEGKIIFASNEKLIGSSLAHREWVQLAARNNAPQTLYLVAPLQSLLNTYVMGLARSVAGPKGEYAGAILASFDPGFAGTQLGSVL